MGAGLTGSTLPRTPLFSRRSAGSVSTLSRTSYVLFRLQYAADAQTLISAFSIGRNRVVDALRFPVTVSTAWTSREWTPLEFHARPVNALSVSLTRLKASHRDTSSSRAALVRISRHLSRGIHRIRGPGFVHSQLDAPTRQQVVILLCLGNDARCIYPSDCR